MNKELLSGVYELDFDYRDKLDFDKKYKFGIEIEFEKIPYLVVQDKLSKNMNLRHWKLHNEPTVQGDDLDSGGEIVSPILHNYKSVWLKIQKACNLLKDLGAETIKYCGAHIHIDQGILCDNNEYILNLLKIWTVYEHVIYYFSYGEINHGRDYICNFAHVMAPILERFIKNNCSIDSKNLYKDIMNFSFKSSVLKGGLWFADCKGVKFDAHNTIEIRCPNGTLNEKIWQNNINFFIHLLETCASDNLDVELLDFKLENYKNYYNYNSDKYLKDAYELSEIVYDKDIDKIYFLKQYTKKI